MDGCDGGAKDKRNKHCLNQCESGECWSTNDGTSSHVCYDCDALTHTHMITFQRQDDGVLSDASARLEYVLVLAYERHDA